MCWLFSTPGPLHVLLLLPEMLFLRSTPYLVDTYVYLNLSSNVTPQGDLFKSCRPCPVYHFHSDLSLPFRAPLMVCRCICGYLINVFLSSL